MNEHIQTWWEFLQEERGKLLIQTMQHIALTLASLFLAVLAGLPLGIWISRKKRFAGVVLGSAGVLQTIPSLALLGFMIPVFGIGPKPAIAALFLYALLPIVRNTYAGIEGVDPTLKEAARAMGMSRRQQLLRVELPLAMPVIFAGIRTATVINVGVATLASYIAAGGLGEFIFGGISLNNTPMILAGAIPAALLAICFDLLLARIQRMRLRRLRTLTLGMPLISLVALALYSSASAYGDRLVAGFTPEFMGRRDGNAGLEHVYGLKLHPLVISDAIMYKAAYEKNLDVISGYSTDGRLKAYGLSALVDDKKIFPPYDAAPVVAESALKRLPQLEAAINLLAGRISDSVMRELNYRTDYLHQSPAYVARSFLRAQGLWRPARGGKSGTVRIGSKIFGEQYILANIYTMLIEGYTDYQPVTSTGLGGTSICFNALLHGRIDLYPEYTGTGLLAILHAPATVLRQLKGDRQQTYVFVRREFLRRYPLRWLRPIGFNNAYALMMRQNEARQLGIKTISDLKRYEESK